MQDIYLNEDRRNTTGSWIASMFGLSKYKQVIYGYVPRFYWHGTHMGCIKVLYLWVKFKMYNCEDSQVKKLQANCILWNCLFIKTL